MSNAINALSNNDYSSFVEALKHENPYEVYQKLRCIPETEAIFVTNQFFSERNGYVVHYNAEYIIDIAIGHHNIESLSLEYTKNRLRNYIDESYIILRDSNYEDVKLYSDGKFELVSDDRYLLKSFPRYAKIDVESMKLLIEHTNGNIRKRRRPLNFSIINGIYKEYDTPEEYDMDALTYNIVRDRRF